jgi:hypothetical protein
MSRIKILEPIEIKRFNTPPVLTNDKEFIFLSFPKSFGNKYPISEKMSVK